MGNLFFVVAAGVALLAPVTVSAKDQQQGQLRGGPRQHRALEVHNDAPTEAAEYFEGEAEEEEEFLSLEEREEMGLDAEDRDLAYNGAHGNGNRYIVEYYGRGSGYGSSG